MPERDDRIYQAKEGPRMSKPMGAFKSILAVLMIASATFVAGAVAQTQDSPAGHKPDQADKIVQGDFDRSLGAVVAVHSAVHGCDRARNIRWIALPQRRIQMVNGRNNALERIASVNGRGGCLTPTDDSARRFDPHENIVGAPDFLACHDDGLAHRQADRDRLNGSDLHAEHPAFLRMRPPSS